MKRQFLGGVFALAISSAAAMAAPIGNLQLKPPPIIVEAQLFCPPGTHPGYEGKYCWPDRPRVCPRGYHLGYEGKYCWPNR
jgi:hypothetical protein